MLTFMSANPLDAGLAAEISVLDGPPVYKADTFEPPTDGRVLSDGDLSEKSRRCGSVRPSVQA